MKKILLGLFFALPLLSLGQSSSIQSEFIGIVEFNEERVFQLAEAIPAESYSWAPSPGIRNFSQSMMHVATGNYFFAMIWGSPPPADVDLMTLEQNITEKEDVIKALQASYDHLKAAAAKISDEGLDRKVQFPDGTEYTVKTTMFIVTEHIGEHKGQLVAYARMNGIAPPWSK